MLFRKQRKRRTENIRIILAAGGSGGHIFPCTALAAELKKSRTGNIVLVSSNRLLDRNILSKEKYKCYFLSVNPMPRTFSVKGTIIFIIKCSFDLLRSLLILAKIRPHVVAGFGGFSSWAICFAAGLCGIPLLIHEQNAVPGKANLALRRTARKIALSFESSAAHFGKCRERTVFTGNPIRLDILSKDRNAAAERMKIDPFKTTVLILGGSQGAKFLNRIMTDTAFDIMKDGGHDVQFIHITGRGDDHKEISRAYAENNIQGRVFSFLENIGDAYAVCDIAVSRSGAAAVFELAYYGHPMILVPYPAAGNSQILNARHFESHGAAICRLEKELSRESMKHDILELIRNKDRLRSMKEASSSLALPRAAKDLASEIMTMV